MHKRIAIVGGDERIQRLSWPKDLDIRFYQGASYGGNGPLKALLNGLSAGRFEAVVVLTRWLGHATYHTIQRHAGCRVIRWERGAPELIKALPNVIQPQQRRA